MRRRLLRDAAASLFSDASNLSKSASLIDRRRLEVLRSQSALSQIRESGTVAALRDSLTGLFLSRGFDVWMGEKSLTANGADREAQYRSATAVGKQASDLVIRLIEGRNRLARETDFKNYFLCLLETKGFGEEEFVALLSNLKELTDEPYRRAIGGKSALHIWELNGLQRDILSKFDFRFPVESHLSWLKASLQRIGFDIDNLPIYFDTEVLANQNPSASAFLIRVPGDIRLVARLNNGAAAFQGLAEAVGGALSAAHYGGREELFGVTIDSAWSFGMQRIVSRLCRQSSWLTSYAGLSAAAAQQYREALVMYDAIEVRLGLVRLRFALEAYRIPPRELNELFWDLCEEYLSVVADDDLAPWAADLSNIEHPLAPMDLLVGDIIAAQTLAFLEREYGSVVDNKNTSSFLVQNYYRFGSRYSWRQLLQRGTDERLNPAYLFPGNE